MQHGGNSSLKSMLQAARIYAPLRWLARDSLATCRAVLDDLVQRSRRSFEDYARDHAVQKLHIGCGNNYLTGWFNTDLFPNARRARLNAVRTYPFPDNSFDFIFTEHMIEHVPYMAAHKMLMECLRVLKPGGVLRLVTPDLKFLIDLYQQDDALRQDYVKWSASEFFGAAKPHDKISVINNFFHDWGHQYIYDAGAMRKLMQEVGFGEINQCSIGESIYPELRQLEHEKRMPPGFLALESLIIEAKKPG